MTTTVKIHVNGHYRATVKQDDLEPVTVDGNYEGSPNPSGERSFYLAHPAKSTFAIEEEISAPNTTPAAAETRLANLQGHEERTPNVRFPCPSFCRR